MEWPVCRDRMVRWSWYCACASRHRICTSVACLDPVGGTRGCCSIADACGSMNRLPSRPAASSMAAWPYAAPMPTVYSCMPCVSVTTKTRQFHQLSWQGDRRCRAACRVCGQDFKVARPGRIICFRCIENWMPNAQARELHVCSQNESCADAQGTRAVCARL